MKKKILIALSYITVAALELRHDRGACLQPDPLL